jgi:predicted RNA-binding protein YlxR (DUF448 family)
LTHAVPLAEDALSEIEPVEIDQPDAGPCRRCIATGVVAAKDALLRFVVAPDGALVPDLQQRLPGRGIYVAATRAAIDLAVKKRAFSRAVGRPIEVPADLADRLEAQLAERAIDLIGLARRAGQTVLGYDQVAAWLKTGRAVLLVQAADGAPAGRARLAAMAVDRPVLEVLRATELAQAFGRDHVVHAAFARGGIAKRLQGELARLSGLRRQDQEAETA